MHCLQVRIPASLTHAGIWVTVVMGILHMQCFCYCNKLIFLDSIHVHNCLDDVFYFILFLFF